MPLRVTAFTDFACPYSYITESAIWAAAESTELAIEYHALELYPSPSEAIPPTEEEGLRENLQPLLDESHIALELQPFRPRTRKAHEAAMYAEQQGASRPMREAIYRAYWEDGRDISRIDELIAIADGLGLDGESLRIALDIDQFSPRIMRDREIAERLRISAVPVVYFGSGHDARILVGAQTPAVLDEFLASG